MTDINLNVNAKVYKPKEKNAESITSRKENVKSNAEEIDIDKISLEVKSPSSECIPKETGQEDSEFVITSLEKEVKDEVALFNEDEINMLFNENIEDEEESETDETDRTDLWYPEYKDCECCKGYVNRCEGETCIYLGKCFCKVSREADKMG
jgi:hypothetical protein